MLYFCILQQYHFSKRKCNWNSLSQEFIYICAIQEAVKLQLKKPCNTTVYKTSPRDKSITLNYKTDNASNQKF